MKLSTLISRYAGIGIISLCLLSCAAEPDPAPDHIPEIKSISAEVKMNMCTLSCMLSAKLDSSYEVGFYYGYAADNMTKVPVGRTSSRDFALQLTSLAYETDYVFKAYISNGKNEICSNIERFRTEKESYMYLIEKEKRVSYRKTEFDIELLTNVAYEVIIPDDVDWISYYDVVSRFYMVVQGNTSPQPRSCELVFNSLYHNSKQVFKLYQEGYDVNSDDLVISQEEVVFDHKATTFTITVGGNVEFDVHIPSDVNWLAYSRKGRDCVFALNVNDTYNPRNCEVLFIRRSDNYSEPLSVFQFGRVPID